jgi:hypothetical protein
MGQGLQMVVAELSDAKGADRNEIDADSIAPYLSLVLLLAVA